MLIRITISVLLILCLGACGSSGAPTPVAEPVPIEFNKAPAAVDISALTSVESETVDVGTEVCDAVRSAFVNLMGYFEGVSVSQSSDTNSYEATVSGQTLSVNFTAWDEFGCSGNTGTFPVCYRGYVNGRRMFAGYVTTAPTGSGVAGEKGSIWIEFDPSGTDLSSSIGQMMFIRADYDLSDSDNPTITIDASGDPDGSGSVGSVVARCVMTKDDASSSLPKTLLQMHLVESDGDILYNAKTDGSSTSVKIQGGEYATGSTPICVDNSGQTVNSCGDVDVSSLSFVDAPSNYTMSGSDVPMSTEGSCVTSDYFATDTISKGCWLLVNSGLPAGTAEVMYTIPSPPDGYLHIGNPNHVVTTDMANQYTVIEKTFDAEDLAIAVSINEIAYMDVHVGDDAHQGDLFLIELTNQDNTRWYAIVVERGRDGGQDKYALGSIDHNMVGSTISIAADTSQTINGITLTMTKVGDSLTLDGHFPPSVTGPVEGYVGSHTFTSELEGIYNFIIVFQSRGPFDERFAPDPSIKIDSITFSNPAIGQE